MYSHLPLHSPAAQPFSKKQGGFSLIEVLVSIVILGLGMLGSAGLQLATLRSNQYTAQSSVATQLARDYEEITQMLRSASIATSGSASVLTAVDTTTDTAADDCKGSGSACNPDKLAAFMLKEWKARVKTELPGGRAKVCRDSAPKETSGANAGLYRWDCDDKGDMLMFKIGWIARADKPAAVMQAVAADSRPRIVMTVFGNQADFTD